jgi:hypothetical protein
MSVIALLSTHNIAAATTRFFLADLLAYSAEVTSNNTMCRKEAQKRR